MRIFILANNHVGLQVTRWLAARDESIVGVAIHPPDKARFATEIIEASKVTPDAVFDGARLNQPDIREAIKSLQPDMAISILFDFILKKPVIDCFPNGVINLHPAYLPFNRGQYPNVWSIVEGTPAGVTIHYLDAGIDTGDIIAQKEAVVEPTDTGKSLYHRLEEITLRLFKQEWPKIKEGAAPRTPQTSKGTFHRTRDVDRIDEIELDRTYTGRDLINILRARTFPPYPSAFFRVNGKKVYIRVQLEEESPDNDR